MVQRKIILRGDDAGSCEEANAGILQLVQAGVLRNVSVMACCSAVESAAKSLAAIKGVCIGLHVTLNAEWTRPKWGPVLPASDVPSIVDSAGHFRPSPVETFKAGARVDEMAAEIEAQLARLRSLGLNIEYIDEHMGVSDPWPELRRWISDFARKQSLVDSYTIPYAQTPDGLNPAVSFDDLAQAFAALPAGVHVRFTHPAMIEAAANGREQAAPARGSWAEAKVDRDRERRTLLDPRVPSMLESLGIESIRYTDL